MPDGAGAFLSNPGSLPQPVKPRIDQSRMIVVTVAFIIGAVSMMRQQ